MSTIRIHHTLNASLTLNGRHFRLEPLLQVLNGIKKQGNLRAAANECGFSYRKSWNILNQFEELFGLALVIKKRGKGSQLSDLGEKLLDIFENNKRVFSVNLTTADTKANTLLNKVLSQEQPLKIIASDSEILNKLRQQHLAIELHIDGSHQAISAYAEGNCELAGFHIAPGKNKKQQLADYFPYLDKQNDQFLLLEQRQQGIISHPERPLHSFQQIVEQQLTFVNRQNGSGTRLLLDLILKDQNIIPEQLPGYYHEEHTHLAVASLIASRQADAGLGIHSAADKLKLFFSPITNEYYFLVFKNLTPKLEQVLKIINENQTLEILDYKAFINTLTDRKNTN